MGSDLTVSTDPAEVGFDAGRLERLDRRLSRWVDDGQLPGFGPGSVRHRAAQLTAVVSTTRGSS